MSRPVVAGAPRSASHAAALAAASVLAAALVAWAVLVARMRGMDAGPGTDLGGLAWYTGVWLTMTAAMMLPSAAPMVAVVAGTARRRGASSTGAAATAWLFVGGYVAVWTAAGLAAYGGLRAATAGLPAPSWRGGGHVVAGAAVVLAGLYELTPLKGACLRWCRTPLAFVLHHWRRGPAGAVAMGIRHGAWCLGCCAGLMIALFGIGVMSLTWMALVSLAILAEKCLPAGRRITIAVGTALLALGLWIVVAPATVPGLGAPRGRAAMGMDAAPR